MRDVLFWPALAVVVAVLCWWWFGRVSKRSEEIDPEALNAEQAEAIRRNHDAQDR
tara:strand:+ start:14657 stop:14821 length:165 start_codon:yes stop_codon:yes gene_type:complete